jgi:hypothetical protein
MHEELQAEVRRLGRDFDVHSLDPLVQGHEGDVRTYLNACFSGTLRLMSIDEIRDLMHRHLRGFSAEDDVSPAYLDEAFARLSPGLIPMFLQIYTLIYTHGGDFARREAVRSFISNVNRFRGACCYQGFINRMVTDFLINIVGPRL